MTLGRHFLVRKKAAFEMRRWPCECGGAAEQAERDAQRHQLVTDVHVSSFRPAIQLPRPTMQGLLSCFEVCSMPRGADRTSNSFIPGKQNVITIDEAAAAD
jgi:hypothetical protein